MIEFTKRRACTAIAAVGLIAAGPVGAQDDPLKVGLLLPFTGQYAWVGENVQPVARMIAEEVNTSGGIGGREISFVQGDTEGVVDAGTTAAQKLINVDNVMALVGPTSLSFSGSKNLIIDNGVPMVTPTAGTTELDRACRDVCFRTVPSDALGGRAIARAATDAQYLAEGASTWENPVLMVAQSPAMVSFLEPIERSFADYGTEVARVIEFTPGKPSYRAEVQEALGANPDGIVLVAAPEDSARVMTNAFQSGYDGDWFVTQDQTNADYIDLASAELVEGIYGLEEVASEEGQALNRAFEERYQDYAGEEVKIFGTNTYDAMNVVALAMLSDHMDDGEITRATLAEHIRAVSDPGEDKTQVTSYTEGKQALQAGEKIDYRGLVGPIDFDDWGNIAAPFGIRQVQGGAWSTVAVIPAAALD
ncbi:ABC transporter substrate-binding protein [Sediminimonas sp.]|uniref:ABC transporter substrate-binding protein n=1 Tax=Sediminimonas sp. TaxID=2823379 RepID=UPI0025FB001C|nr:ABC transporter substrate-binding protein [Sediminimonas sp.]